MVIFIVTVLWDYLPSFIFGVYLLSLNSVYTNNAYVRGQITLISPKVSGYIKAVSRTGFWAGKKRADISYY